MRKKRHSILCILLLFCLTAIAEESARLTGIPIGSTSYDYIAGNISTTVNVPSCAFDGNFDTFYASNERSFTWVGLDLGEPHVITKVGWSPRFEQAHRVQLALFEGSSRPDFLDAVPLYLVPEPGEEGVVHHAEVNVTRAFRYVRYVGPNDARCNVSEVEFYGYAGVGKDSLYYQITNLPTLSIHTYAGIEPYDKDNDLDANMTLIYDNGTRIQEYPITTRLRGNASVNFPKKPYRIKFDDGKSHHMMKGSPLESPAKAKKWTLINNYGDKTLMRNMLAFECSRRFGMSYTPYCQPVDVIMNGEYKGCYQLCDQITIDPNRVPIAEMSETDNEEPFVSGGYLLEVDGYASESYFTSNKGIPVTIKEPDEDKITPEQFAYISNYFNQMEEKLWGDEYTDSLNGYKGMLDIESFLRHFLVGEFSGNTDTYWSTYMYKDREQGKFYVGPVWDFDIAFNNDQRIYPVCDREDWLFRTGGSSAGNMAEAVTRILTDPYVKKRLNEIWTEGRQSGLFSEASLVAYVDSLEQVLDASQRLNFKRWPILSDRVHENAFAKGSYEAEVDVVRQYMGERIAWIDQYLQDIDYVINTDSIYYISTPQQLVDFARDVKRGANMCSAHLMNNIDMEGYSDAFIPIGSTRSPYFGEFDGGGYTISNLHVSGRDYTGLFGVVKGDVYIHDLTLDQSCRISGEDYVAFVGGSNDSGTVTLEQVGNEADVTGTGMNVAGLIGVNMNSSATFVLRNCYNTGRISGNRESAGLSGWLGNNATVENCYNIGIVEGVGGNYTFARYGYNPTFINCYELNSRQTADVISVNAVAVSSGELCYRLCHGNTPTGVWRQNLGADNYPVLLSSHAEVLLKGGAYTNTMLLPGDVNSDGTVNVTDFTALANYILGNTPVSFDPKAADLNGDGNVNVTDLIAVANMILSGDASVRVKPQRTYDIELGTMEKK